LAKLIVNQIPESGRAAKKRRREDRREAGENVYRVDVALCDR
jgi:hypothetical protein